MAQRKGSIEGLKNALYSRKEGVEIDPNERTPLSEDNASVPVAWESSQEPVTPAALNTMMMAAKKRWSMPVKFLIGSGLFFIIAAGISVFMFFFGGNSISPQNIDLRIVMPSVVDGGKTTNLQFIISNHNQANLKLVDLVINYPAGTRDPGNQTSSLTHERQSIGAVNSGQTVQTTSQAMFYGQEGQQQQISVQLQYSVEGSNAVFEKDAAMSFTVGSSPLSITLTSPAEAISNQQFSMDVNVQSNALDPVNDVVIQAQYPFGFTPTATTPQASAGGTLWHLGTMQPGDSKTLHITGTLVGQDGDSRVFYFLAGSDSDPTDTTIPVPFLSVPQTLTVHRPFITADIALNNQTGKTIPAPAGSTVQGTITWTNNLPDPVSDVELSLAFSGPTLDTNSINSSEGFYQSSDETLVWSKDHVSDLAAVPPGGTGTLPFSFTILPSGSGGTLYSNPTINLNLTVKGVRQGQTNVPETVSSAASTQVLVSSAALLTAAASHFSGPFANTGPMPPQAGTPTTYAIVWTVKNTSNTIANGTVSATLPTYVTFVGAQSGSGISYDSGSRTVTWAMGDVKAGAGFTSAARTAAFQVSLLPSTSQSGQAPALTSQAALSGEDRFAQVSVNATAGAPTTQLVNDPGFNSTMGTVR